LSGTTASVRRVERVMIRSKFAGISVSRQSHRSHTECCVASAEDQ
jgi:hypothetical protein